MRCSEKVLVFVGRFFCFWKNILIKAKFLFYMNLIILYGPPASGKYTLGKELSSFLNYKFLHNSAINDLTLNVLNKDHHNFLNFRWYLRELLISEAVNQGVNGLVMTRAGNGSDKEIVFFNKIKELIEENKGKFILINLVCPKNVLEKRVILDSRKNFLKINSVKDLNNWFKNYKKVEILENDYVLDFDVSKDLNSCIINLKKEVLSLIN